MASRQNKQKIAEKVSEIKRMQSNWMKQRASDPNSEGTKKTSANHQSRPGNKPEGTKKQETMTWAVSTGGDSSKKKNLRTRSASPARKQKSATNTQQSVKPSRPSSGRSNPGSRPSSSRDNNASRKPPLAKGSVSDRGVSSNNVSNLRLSTRTESEPNLFVKEDDTRERTQTDDEDNSRYFDKRRSTNGFDDTELTNQSNVRTSSINRSENQHSSNRSGSDQSKTSSSHAVQSELRNNHDNQSQLDTNHAEHSETRSGRLMEADAFDRLADQIASRVKAEMRQERQDVRQSSGLPLKSILDDDNVDDILSSHHCIKCKQKMIPPDYIPTVLIPCGHTFCEPCAEDRIKCPTCRAKVSSTAENSTLLQIIMGSTPYKKNNITNKQTPKLSNQNSLQKSNQNYRPTNYESDDELHATENRELAQSKTNSFKQNDYDQVTKVEKSVARKRVVDPKVRAQNYISEFESLSIRCEAMREEEETVMEDVEKTNREITQQRKTMGNISRQQDKIREEIQQLQDKIALLDEHRTEYERKCQELEEDKTEKMNQLHMVRQMARQLEGDQNRVRMLAQGLGVYLE